MNIHFRRFLLLLLLFGFLAGCSLPFAREASPEPAPASAPLAAVTREPLPSPTAAPAPTVTAAPLVPDLPAPTPMPQFDDDDLALIAANPRLPRDMVELAIALGDCRDDPADCPAVAREQPLDVAVGDVEPFWLTDIVARRNFEIEAELRYAGPHVLMYVDTAVAVNQQDLVQAAQTFEQEIYPRTRELFGSEWQPGVDGDPRITILNGRNVGGGVIGYFSAADAVPRSINRFSNEREMFYMNIEWLDPADPTYLDTLAHEFQHMIHQNEQRKSATWFNEGLATLSQDLNGFISQGFTALYISDPDVQLNAWGNQPGTSGGHYGAAHLFMRYIYTQYAEPEDIRELLRANAGNNLAAFSELAVQSRSDVDSFTRLYGDWAVANLLNDPAVADGRYSYPALPELSNALPSTVVPQVIGPGETSGRVHQFGSDYLELPPGPLSLEFSGDAVVGVAAERPQGNYAWWSNRSDNSVATLSRSVDLRGLERATLEFDTWFEIENDYDYAFVTVSTDGGRTWETLPGLHTTDADPQGVNYGHGISGISGSPGVELGDGPRGQWVSERMDLTPYAGRQIELRFWQITDEGFNAPGILIDNIRIPELDFADDVENGANNWQAEGFVRFDTVLPQRWSLRLVITDAAGQVRVATLQVDDQGQARASLADGERGVLVISGATPYTTEQANYRVIVN